MQKRHSSTARKATKRRKAPTSRLKRRQQAGDNEETARLKRELSEALEHQDATSEVLNVISRSTFDLQTVLETLTRSAAHLCAVEQGVIFLREGDVLRMRASYGFPAEALEFARANPMKLNRGSATGRVALEGRPVHIEDVLADPEYSVNDYQKTFGYRTVLSVPLLRESSTIGVFALTSDVVKPFSDRQIKLATTFAAQAVIAIENARLFEEVKAKTDDLAESLQQQTATADVLKVISRSTFDLQTVLDTLVESATHLCEADHSWLFQRDGDFLQFKASFGHGTATHERIRELFQRRSVPIDRGSISGRSALGASVVHVADVLADPDYTFMEAQQIGGYRAALGAPLLRDGKVVGVIFVAKTRPEPFSARQIELVTTFADQAVIAIENVRLFNETQEALERQTATTEVLEVINSSPGNLAPVFDAMLEKAIRLC